MKIEARPYRMVRRAASTARTRDSILDAAVRRFWAEPGADVTLERVAGDAGVTVQTLIRHFGGRDGLLRAAVEREAGRVAAERDAATATTPELAVRQLVDHYERLGDGVVRMLAEESGSTAVAEIAERGRAFHRAWCERVFAVTLSRAAGATRRRRLAQLAAVCDVYTWKLLRRDAGLSRRATEQALLELLIPLLEVH
jgi:AcrR family transcriptional regulator